MSGELAVSGWACVKSFRPTVLLSSLLVVAGGCTIDVDGDDDGSTGATAETDPAASGGDESGSGTDGWSEFSHCEPDPQAPLSGDAMGSFSGANEDGQASTMGLSAPAGGYVTATFTPGLARGGLFAFGSGDADVFNTVEQDYEEPVDIAFLAAPGVAYQLEARQQGNANPDEYPFGWALSWSAVPIPDCWEPNNSMGDASDVALGHAISGYINAGQSGGDPVAPADWLDFYRFEVEEAGTLRVDMMQVPGDGLVRARVLDQAGEQVGSIEHPSEETEPFSDVVDLGSGTYFLEVNPFLLPTQRVADDAEGGIPSSWTTPYTFELSLDPA